MIKIIRNTYPKYPNVAHAEPGDLCKWELVSGSYRLTRISDHETLFSTSTINQTTGLLSSGKPPRLIGVIAQVKSKGWVMEVEETK